MKKIFKSIGNFNKAIFKKVFNGVKKYLDDMLLSAGCLLLSYGTYKIYKPAGIILLGLCLITIAYLYAKRRGD